MIGILFNIASVNKNKITNKNVKKLKYFNFIFITFLGLNSFSFINAFLNKNALPNEIISFAIIFYLLLLFALTSASAFFYNNKEKNYFYLIASSFILYVFINGFLFYIGIDTPSKNYLKFYFNLIAIKCSMLGLMGINSNRILFPIATNINAFGTIAGFVIFLGWFLLRNNRILSVFSFVGLVGIISGVYCNLYADSRAALIFAIITISLYEILPANLRFISKYLPILILIIPLLFVIISPYTNQLSILNDLSRNETDAMDLGGRFFIWKTAISELSNFRINHLFGFGWYGQSGLGLFNGYRKVSNGFLNPEKISMHNFALQHIIDTGYLGIIIFLILLYLLYQYYLSENNKTNLMVIFSVNYLVLTSATEINLNVYSISFFFFLLLVISNIFSHKIYK